MLCEDYLVLISAHLDGATSEDEEQQLQAHLRLCPDCRARLESYAAMDAALSAEDALPPPDLQQRIMQAVEAAPRSSRRRRIRIALGSGLAAAACLTALLVSLPTLRQRSLDAADNAAFFSGAADSNSPSAALSEESADTFSSSTALRRPELADSITVTGRYEFGTSPLEAAHGLLVFWDSSPAALEGLAALEESHQRMSTLNGEDALSAALRETLGAACETLDSNALLHLYTTDLRTLRTLAASNPAASQTLYAAQDLPNDAPGLVLVVEADTK